MSATALADIVGSRAEASALAREPLLILDPLTGFLDDHGLGEGPLAVEPIGDGRSNVTYSVRRGELEFVLRRPPRGPLPPSAHDVMREVRVLSALAGEVRVPRVLAACEDPSLIGAPFFVMEKLEGCVITTSTPPPLADPADRRALASELIDALIEIHAVDWRAAGLGDFGRPDGYLERQLRRFGSLWEHNRTRELPVVDRVIRLLLADPPRSPESTVVHGDFRLGNLVVSCAPPARVVGVLDWEMATIGDPLADLGYLCALWSEAEDPDLGDLDLSAVTREPGYPTRAQLVESYAERSGRCAGRLDWYQAFALWKACVFMEGNLKRAVAGSSDDQAVLRFATEGVPMLADRAEELLS